MKSYNTLELVETSVRVIKQIRQRMECNDMEWNVRTCVYLGINEDFFS